MTASHGRVGRRNVRWSATVLAASGLLLAASGGRPARACHIHHSSNQETASGQSSTHPGTATSTSTSAPSESFAQALQTFLKDWHDKSMPPPPMPAGTPTSGMTHPAAEYLVPPAAGSTTVQNWHQTAPCTCTTPPPPPCTGGTPTTASAQGVAPSPSAASTGLAQGSPTPAPEPSTILSAIALAGSFAWGRRATRSRG